MRKKLQVFVSSTFTDLIIERQTAVKSILNAGHIPAGMELFTAGDDSQQELIKKWIEESDVYMLILGGRYGSLLPTKDKSYTHWEYEYAGTIGKPRFAIVLSDSAIQKKIELTSFKEATEHENPQLYKDFRSGLLTSKLVSIVDDNKDIELSIFKSLREIELRPDLSGWISGKDIPDMKVITGLYEENSRLVKENNKLNAEKTKPKLDAKKSEDYNGFTFEELLELLAEEIQVPELISKEYGKKSVPIIDLFLGYNLVYSGGAVHNASNATEKGKFLFYTLASHLIKFDFVSRNKVTGKTYERILITKIGARFITRYEQHLKNIG